MLLLIVLLSGIIGYVRGAIRSGLLLVALGFAAAATVLLCVPALQWLQPLLNKVQEQWHRPIAAGSVCVSVFLLLTLLFYPLKKSIQPQVHGHLLNRLGGIVTGLAIGLLISASLSLVLPDIDNAGISSEWNGSVVAKKLVAPLGPVEEMLRQSQEQKVASVPPPVVKNNSAEAEPFSKLAYSTRQVVSRPDLELLMLRLVNEERKEQNLKPLVADQQMALVGRKHAEDMFGRGYFSHNTPEGVDPFVRMKMAKIKYKLAGENLAMASNLMSAHINLMKSPGHRANILKRGYGRVGISVLDGGMHGLMIAQEFRD